MKPSELTYTQLSKYVEGEVTASQTEILDAALAVSKESRFRLARVQKAVNHFSNTDDVADIDLLPAIRQRIAALPSEAAPSRRFSVKGLILSLAAAAVLFLAMPAYFLASKSEEKSTPEGIRAKSATDGHDSRKRWIALNAFHLSENEAPVRLGETLHPDGGLLFSYTNLGPTPFRHLMVFAIDETGQVYWYYPAFLDERDNPKGIRIKSGVSREGLHEVIAHPYKEGELVLFGLFSDTALSVSDIENSVEKGIADANDFEKIFDGSRVKMLKVMVTK
jgi:hypothetical protein